MNENENENEMIVEPCLNAIAGCNERGAPICNNKTCLHNLGGLCIPDEHIGD